ncbi:hypothetical protein ACSDR0_50300, partial [Streptosporangium sp. G11]|uniref:hypothetical protein n=1 Tax=Streptosporangium sp. G11 TaxID=3436926 RepID=UPI003EBE2437
MSPVSIRSSAVSDRHSASTSSVRPWSATTVKVTVPAVIRPVIVSFSVPTSVRCDLAAAAGGLLVQGSVIVTLPGIAANASRRR